MIPSVLDNEKRCYICHSEQNLEQHHIFFGTSNREQSERFGCWVWLCNEHHTGSNMAAHHNRGTDLFLKRRCEITLLNKGWTIERFIKIFGRNYV